MADGSDQLQLLEQLLRDMSMLLGDTEAGRVLTQLQPILQNPRVHVEGQRLQDHRQRKPTRFFFGRPDRVGPDCTYPNAFRFQAGPETCELVGSGMGGSLTHEEQQAASRAMEGIGMPVEGLGS